jgi:phosphoglycolate phosphatase
MLLQAMAEAGAEPESTVLVGDTSFDMEMARNAGVAAIGVSWGYHPVEELERTGAHRVIERFDELHDLVDALVT